MGTKLRVLMVLIGALLVVATFTYPSWRPAPVDEVQESEFPGLPQALQDDFQALPERIRRGYLLMRQIDEQQALALLTTRIGPPATLPPEEQVLPPIEGAGSVGDGTFGPPQLLDEEDERELPPFSDLYSASGNITIYLFPDDRKLLRIENLSVVNGPNLRVALSTEVAPIFYDELGTIFPDLGSLRATSGNMNFEIPRELDMSRYHSIVIFDADYEIIFAVARIG